jgi:hypothetical protein
MFSANANYIFAPNNLFKCGRGRWLRWPPDTSMSRGLRLTGNGCWLGGEKGVRRRMPSGGCGFIAAPGAWLTLVPFLKVNLYLLLRHLGLRGEGGFQFGNSLVPRYAPWILGAFSPNSSHSMTCFKGRLC